MITHSFVIGIVSLAHIALAGLAVGFMVLAPVTEFMGRKNPVYLPAAYAMTRFTVITFTVSAVLAVIMMELFIGWFPLMNSWLFNQFRYPLFVAMAAFLLLLFLLYPYYHSWSRIRSKSIGLHECMGITAACLIMVWVGVLDGIGSYMLTPVETEGSWGDLLNPTWIPLVIHRFFGNLLLAGFVMAGYAGWQLARTHTKPDCAYYLTVLKFGSGIGVVCLLIQPFSGLLYASHIQQAAPAAIDRLVDGHAQAWLYLQFGLIALLFVGSHWLLHTLHAQPSRHWLGEGLYVFLAVLMVGFATEPLARRVVTAMIVLQTLWFVISSPRAVRPAEVSHLNQPRLRGLCMVLGMTALLTYWTMGTIRETVRGPERVHGMMTLQFKSPRSPQPGVLNE